MRREGLFFGCLPACLVFAIAISHVHPCRANEQSYEDVREKASYGLGYTIGSELARHRVGIEPGIMLKGIRDGLDGATPEVPAWESERILQEIKSVFRYEMRVRKNPEIERYRTEGREFLRKNALEEGVNILDNGLQYRVLRPGTGVLAGYGDTVTLHYLGRKVDGTLIADTRREGSPRKFRVGGMLPGLNTALSYMREGALWEIVVPADQAYNERGPLADHTLIFEMELLRVESAGAE